VQHELLKAVRDQIPHVYSRADLELGLTVARTQELIDKSEIISAAGAIKLARMIAYEPNARDVFGVSGHNVFSQLNEQLPSTIRATARTLPRLMRLRFALSMTRRIAHSFAGSLNQVVFERRQNGIALTVFDGMFSDRLDTLGCAYSYYRRVFEVMLQQFAGVDYMINEVRRSRVHLNQCNFEIVWEA
jgi:hypothetical protein